MIRSFKELRELRRREEKEQQEKLLLLQNGQVSVSPVEESPSPESIMGLDLSTWEDRSYEQREKSLHDLSTHRSAVAVEKEEDESSGGKAETEAPASCPASAAAVRERSRTGDEQGLKTTRAKRESRRLRELEQAKFSLELLKVRANSGGASSPSEERRWSLELVAPASPTIQSPQGTPDSQSSKGSFELLTMDEEPLKAAEEVTDLEDPFSPVQTVAPVDLDMEAGPPSPKLPDPQETKFTDDVNPENSQSPTRLDQSAPPAPSYPSKLDNYLPTFYVPAREGGSAASQHHHQTTEEPQRDKEPAVSTTTSAILKPLKERREPSRRPVVVVISMQKETPLSEELRSFLLPPVDFRDSAAQTGDMTSSLQEAAPASCGPASQPEQLVMEKLVQLNEEKEERQRHQQQQNEKEMMEQIRQQKEALEQQRLIFAQYEKDMFEKQKEEAMLRIEQSHRGGQDATRTTSPVKTSRPSSLLIKKTSQQPLHGRTQSDSTPPPLQSPPALDGQGRGRYPQLPPPPSSAPTERRKDSRPPAEGWAPKLTLESRAGSRTKTAAKKIQHKPVITVSLTDKPANIFFSPNDKVTFTS